MEQQPPLLSCWLFLINSSSSIVAKRNCSKQRILEFELSNVTETYKYWVNITNIVGSSSKGHHINLGIE